MLKFKITNVRNDFALLWRQTTVLFTCAWLYSVELRFRFDHLHKFRLHAILKIPRCSAVIKHARLHINQSYREEEKGYWYISNKIRTRHRTNMTMQFEISIIWNGEIFLSRLSPDFAWCITGRKSKQSHLWIKDCRWQIESMRFLFAQGIHRGMWERSFKDFQYFVNFFGKVLIEYLSHWVGMNKHKIRWKVAQFFSLSANVINHQQSFIENQRNFFHASLSETLRYRENISLLSPESLEFCLRIE